MKKFDVTIAGELNLDLILYGVPEELPPERELLVNGMALTPGGSSAIVAHNLAALGIRVGFQSRVGNDPLGQIALDRMTAAGVDVSRVRRVDGVTKTGLTVTLQREHWRNMLTYPGTIFDLSFADLDIEYLTSAQHFHLSSYYLQSGLRPHVLELFHTLKTAELTISLDTNDDPDDRWGDGLWEALEYVDVFLPNEREACRVAGTDNLDDAISRLANRIPLVTVKMGRKGALAQRGGERFTSAALPVNAVDAVGAGDSFNAGFLSQYVRGANLGTCLAWGNLAGALSTTQAGGTEAFRNRASIEAFVREHMQPAGAES